jgi:hypothetical protein
MGLDPLLGTKFLQRVLKMQEKDELEQIKWGHVSTFTKASLQSLITKYFKLKRTVELCPSLLIPVRRLQYLFDIFVERLTW